MVPVMKNSKRYSKGKIRMYNIAFLPPAEKYFKKLKDRKLKNKYESAIEIIRINPYVGKAKHGDLIGIYGYDIFYNKTNYELAYNIVEKPNGDVVVVIMAGTRENFYNAIKSYIK